MMISVDIWMRQSYIRDQKKKNVGLTIKFKQSLDDVFRLITLRQIIIVSSYVFERRTTVLFNIDHD